VSGRGGRGGEGGGEVVAFKQYFRVEVWDLGHGLGLGLAVHDAKIGGMED
jgi:hypothetical protein